MFINLQNGLIKNVIYATAILQSIPEHRNMRGLTLHSLLFETKRNSVTNKCNEFFCAVIGSNMPLLGFWASNE